MKNVTPTFNRAILPPRKSDLAKRNNPDNNLVMRRSGVTIQDFYEAGRRFQFGDRTNIWSYTTDARFDANQATRIELIRKIRYFEQNCSLVQSLADVWEQYVVGANGLILSPGSENAPWAALATEYFKEWSVYPDLTSLQDWACLQGLIARTWFIDGEVFIIKTRGDLPPYRPRLQLIEGHRVGTPPSMAGLEGKSIIDGVDIDAKGRPIGYWVQAGIDPNGYTRIDAVNMIHVFEPTRIGMYRGITHFYAVLNLMHDMDDLARWEMAKAKEAADTTAIIKTPTGEVLDDATDFDKQTENFDNFNGEVVGGKNPLTEFYLRVFGPTKKVMKIGDEYEVPTPNNPTTSQQWYWRYIAEQICNGVGVAIILIYPESIQGTVYRGILDKQNSQFRSRSAVLASKLKQVWIYVIGVGATQDKRISNLPPDWTKLTARPPKAVNVDVGRNSAAILAEWRAGTKTLEEICAEKGEDWREVLRQKAKEIKAIHDLAAEFKLDANDLTDMLAEPVQPLEPPNSPPANPPRN
jgi:capsid protein